MRRITNPYVVKCYDDFKTDNRRYIVMEYCDEPTLGEAIKCGAVSNVEAVIILKQILSGVAVTLGIKVGFASASGNSPGS